MRLSIGNFECYFIHFICHNQAFCKAYLDPLPIEIGVCDFNGLSGIFQSIIMERAKQNYAGKNLYLSTKLTELISILYYSGQTYQTGSLFVYRYQKDLYSTQAYIQEHISLKRLLLPPVFHQAIFICCFNLPLAYLPPNALFIPGYNRQSCFWQIAGMSFPLLRKAAVLEARHI